MKRLAPAFVLFFLAPLVAEFFLGDFPITYLPLILALAPMYGGGALLIREVVRRTGRGWPTILLLALSFGVIEEGLLTQSLFNPHYLDAHLLDDGYLPSLGIAVPWTIFVLTLHTVWSISTPVALVEESTRSRRTRPWLHAPGLVVTTVLFLVGCGFTFATSYSDGHFLAHPAQLGATAVVVVALVVAAFTVPRRRAARPGRVPAPWSVFGLILLAGAGFMLAEGLPVWAGVATAVASLAVASGLLAWWSGRTGWGAPHRLAAAGGALLTYSWHAFTSTPVEGSGRALNLVSHIVFALAAVAVLAEVARRSRRAEPAAVPDEADLAMV